MNVPCRILPDDDIPVLTPSGMPAQYAYEPAAVNHIVTVVGWDDTFAAENWPEDHRTPADGYLLPDIARGQDPEQGKENRK